MRPWLIASLVFASILSLHIVFGSSQTVDPAKLAWIDHVGRSFDVAVVKNVHNP